MGILNLKNKTAYKYIKKQINKADNLENNDVNKIQTVGIIADVDLFKTYDFTKKLSENLGIDKNKIEVVLWNLKETESLLESYPIFSEKSFAMYGKIKEDSLKNFAAKPFDLLINYCEEDTIYAQVLVNRSAAKIKAAFENKYAKFYNLTINIGNNKIDTFNNEIIKYLHILNLLK